MLNHAAYSNNDAWTAYRIESLMDIQAMVKKLNFFLQRSVDLEPYNFEFRKQTGDDSA